jgi:hypothetical protein
MAKLFAITPMITARGQRYRAARTPHVQQRVLPAPPGWFRVAPCAPVKKECSPANIFLQRCYNEKKHVEGRGLPAARRAGTVDTVCPTLTH